MSEHVAKLVPKRKPIAPSVRFEVFKRDSFTCQYCGAKSPDVVLQIDHIHPVAAGGNNDIMNLVTACSSCNGGKSDVELDDKSVIEKQRQQLEELNERRNQLEMMLKWRDELASLNDDCLEAVQRELAQLTGYRANERGERDIKGWLRKYQFKEVLTAVEKSFATYLKLDEDGSYNLEAWGKAFHMVPRIIEIDRNGGLPPEKQKAFYIRGILRNRLSYVNERDVMGLIQSAIEAGIELDEVQDLAKHCRNWSQFNETLHSWMVNKNG